MSDARGFYAKIGALHEDVTGSCITCQVRYPNGTQTKFIVDFGIFQEKEYKKFNRNVVYEARNADFALLTHCHIDHVGKLPLLIHRKFRGKVYTSLDNKKLIKPTLKGIMVDNVGVEKDEEPLYYENDIKKIVKQTKGLEYGETFEVNEKIKITLFRNGHTIASTMFLVQVSYPGLKDINLFFTGDYKPSNIFFEDLELPQWVKELNLTLITECTNGIQSTKYVEKTFERRVKSATQQGKSVLCPVAAMGRAQEILYILKLMQDKGSLDSNIPIFLDSNRAKEYLEIYQKEIKGIKEEAKDFLPQNFYIMNEDERDDIVDIKNSKIILATSSNGKSGVAKSYIQKVISRENWLIHFTSMESFGVKLQGIKRYKKIDFEGVKKTKLAQVYCTNEFYDHGKFNEILKFLKQFKNLKCVIANHGDKRAKKDFINELGKIYGKKIHVMALSTETTIIINRKGYLKEKIKEKT